MSNTVTWTAQNLTSDHQQISCKGAFRVLIQNRGSNKLFYKKLEDPQFVLYIPGKPDDAIVWPEMILDAGESGNQFDQNWEIKFEGDGTNDAVAIIHETIESNDTKTELIPGS